MKFCFYPLRFEFVARESLYFPPGKAANILRGGFGAIFRRFACTPDCAGAFECEIRASCSYARIFEPVATGAGPSGLADWPRPFVFRARHLDGSTFKAGDPFHFDLNLFLLDQNSLPLFVFTFAALAREGLGPRRGKAELQRVTCRDRFLYEHGVKTIATPPAPELLDLAPASGSPRHVRVEFLTPTELKHEHRIVGRPEFPILFGRIRDRIATLSRLYGAGDLDVDYQGTNERAARIKMIHCDIRRQEVERRSTKTGQVHSIGGFVGTAEYEGDFAEFLPWLNAAYWTGVGRQAVWGKGEIRLVSSRPFRK